MEVNFVELLGQWGIAGAVVFQTWMLFRYLEGKDDDQITRNTERIAALESQREDHAKRLDHHSAHKVGRDTFSREVTRIDKRNASVEKHLAKHATKNKVDDQS